MEKRTIKFGRPLLGEEEKNAVRLVLDGDTLVHGPVSKQFEEKFAGFTGAKHGISVSSCTAGLHLAYFYKKFGAGDEVIVPAQTHNATAHAVELTGAKPVFVDAEINTGNIDIDQIEAAITPATKAISIVHFLGMPVDMEKIMAIAKKHNLYVVEDCALGIGSYFKNRHVGTYGDLGCFSFYPVKHITTAEGGMITTNNEDIYNKILRQRAFGVDRTASERSIPGIYDVTMLGFNYRMSEVHAAIGIPQVDRINDFVTKREVNYNHLENALKDIPEIQLLQSTHGDFKSSYYCLSIILKDELMSKRFEIVQYINNNGVQTSVYYPRPVPHFTYYKDKYGYSEDSFPVASKISYGSIALSVGPHLTIEDMEYTAMVIKDAINKFK